MPNHPKSITMRSFKGINNIHSPESTNTNFLKLAENLDIDTTGGLSKREGYSQVDLGRYTSLWASENGLGCYGVKDNNLVKIEEDYSTSILRSNLSGAKLSFEEVQGLIYYSSSNENGIIDNGINRKWGIDKVNLSPTLSRGVGVLPAGTYMVSYTYIDSFSRESGTTVSSVIIVPDNSSINLFIPSAPYPFARVYCSTTSGNTLYYSGIAVPGSNYTVSTTSNLVNPLRTFNLDSPPLGNIVKLYKGVMYLAVDNILYYSEPFQYDLYNLSNNYIVFPERIKVVCPVEDGIWIGSDRLYYLSGQSPDKFRKDNKEYIKVIEGTEVRFSGSYLHIDNTPVGYKWIVSSNLGVFILFNQGLVINTTEAFYNLDRSDRGSALFIQNKGMNRYLSILNKNQKQSNAVLGDLVETKIIRNGVVLPN
jgi:hypothetical protein